MQRVGTAIDSRSKRTGTPAMQAAKEAKVLCVVECTATVLNESANRSNTPEMMLSIESRPSPARFASLHVRFPPRAAALWRAPRPRPQGTQPIQQLVDCGSAATARPLDLPPARPPQEVSAFALSFRDEDVFRPLYQKVLDAQLRAPAQDL
eukprot:6604374-Prymnesium_polylepis.1